MRACVHDALLFVQSATRTNDLNLPNGEGDLAESGRNRIDDGTESEGRTSRTRNDLYH